MRCEKCYYEQDTDFEICPSCATPVRKAQGTDKSHTAQTQNGTRKKKLSRRRRIRLIKRLSLLAAVLAAFIIVIVLLTADGSAKFVYPDHSVEMLTNSEGVTYFLFDGQRAVEFREDESTIQKVELSKTGKYAVVLTSDGLIYVVNSKKCIKLDDADGVYDFRLSAFDDTLVYLKDYDNYSGGVLCTSELSKPSSSKTVAEGVFCEEVNGIDFLVSPGGETIAYVTDYDGASWTYKVVNKGSRKAKWKGECVKVSAISDGGKYIYYTDEDGNFKVNKKTVCGTDNETVFIAAYYDGNANEALVSYSENASTYTVLVRGGRVCDGERQKGDISSMILPAEIRHEVSADCVYYNVDSFVKTAAGIMVGDDEVYYYIANKSGAFKRLFSGNIGGGEIYISSDCKTIYFRKDQQGSIKYMSLSKYNDQPGEYKSKEDVAHFKMSKNGKHIYFIDNDGNLYYQKNKKTSVKVYSGVSGTEYYVTDSGNVYFGAAYTTSSMELLFSREGAAYSKVRTGSETVRISYSPASDALFFETDSAIYYASSGKGKLVYGK